MKQYPFNSFETRSPLPGRKGYGIVLPNFHFTNDIDERTLDTLRAIGLSFVPKEQE